VRSATPGTRHKLGAQAPEPGERTGEREQERAADERPELMAAQTHEAPLDEVIRNVG
jgi:hypothetical protein